MVETYEAFVAITIVQEIRAHKAHYVWTRSKASNACAHHGNHLAPIVSLGCLCLAIKYLINILNFFPNDFFSEQPANCQCRNGGLCVQLPNYSIGCSCRYGYTGDQCEKSKCSHGMKINIDFDSNYFFFKFNKNFTIKLMNV